MFRIHRSWELFGKKSSENFKISNIHLTVQAKSAIDNYYISPDKIKVVPFGANIDCTKNFHDIKYIINSRPTKLLNLLFVGVKWKRKGRDLAVNIT